MRTGKARALLLGGLLLGELVLAGCSDRDDRDLRFAEPGASRASPSGDVMAVVELGPEQDGVPTWRPVILDGAGAAVFRDDEVYSTRQGGVAVTWLSDADQLWILSGDIGARHVDRGPDGTWRKTTITPDTLATVPTEIRRLRR